MRRNQKKNACIGDDRIHQRAIHIIQQHCQTSDVGYDANNLDKSARSIKGGALWTALMVLDVYGAFSISKGI